MELSRRKTYWFLLNFALSWLLFVQVCSQPNSLSAEAFVEVEEDYQNSIVSTNGIHDLSEKDSEENLLMYTELADLYTSVKLWRHIYIVLGTFLTCLGLLLNSLCIVIFYNSKLFRNSSFPYYVYVIAVIDSINILLRFVIPQSIETWIRSILISRYDLNPLEINVFKFDEYTNQITHDYHCSIFMYLYNSFTLLSVWLMVAVSLERWLVIKFAVQTRNMMKLRAFFILCTIAFIVFSVNVFDLAPDLYTKPQWYANLTLLCERSDTFYQFNMSVKYDMHKNLGPIRFDSDTYVKIRTVFQSFVPFLVVLVFNLMIIRNFKKIKLTALNGRGKSNSCVSLASGVGGVGGSSGGGGSQTFSSMFTQRHERSRRNQRKRHEKLKEKLTSTALLNNNEANNKDAMNNLCSRSPSPYHSVSILNTPATPTSLMSALNLATQQAAVSAPSTPTQDSQTRNKLKHHMDNNNKYSNNTFLMPPSFNGKCGSGFALNSSGLSTNLTSTNGELSDSPNASIQTANSSSANLSVATTTNLTHTTLLNNSFGGSNNSNHNNNNNNNNNNLNNNQNNKQQVENDKNKLSTNNLNVINHSNTSDKLSLIVTSLSPSKHQKNLLCTSQTTILTHQKPMSSMSKVSFRNRSTRGKLSRETDIMLIVLSLCIPLSQLPFAIAWYLIYYHGLLAGIQSIFASAATPKFFYLIRILEMSYFSLNFFFYITLSPSLRKEIKAFLVKVIAELMKKVHLKTNLMKNELNEIKTMNNNNPMVKSNSQYINTKSASNLTIVRNDLRSKSPTNKSAVSFNSNNLYLKTPQVSSRVHSNSSAEYVDYLDRLRSSSPPLNRPSFFLKNTNEDTNDNDNIIRNSEDFQTQYKQQRKLKKFFNLKFGNKKHLASQESGTSNPIEQNGSKKKKKQKEINNKLKQNSSKIKIVIDKLNDADENEANRVEHGEAHGQYANSTTINQFEFSSGVVVENEEHATASNSLTNEKKLLNISTPSFLSSQSTNI